MLFGVHFSSESLRWRIRPLRMILGDPAFDRLQKLHGLVEDFLHLSIGRYVGHVIADLVPFAATTVECNKGISPIIAGDSLIPSWSKRFFNASKSKSTPLHICNCTLPLCNCTSAISAYGDRGERSIFLTSCQIGTPRGSFIPTNPRKVKILRSDSFWNKFPGPISPELSIPQEVAPNSSPALFPAPSFGVFV
jgi:hypothetical protein